MKMIINWTVCKYSNLSKVDITDYDNTYMKCPSAYDICCGHKTESRTADIYGKVLLALYEVKYMHQLIIYYAILRKQIQNYTMIQSDNCLS